MKQKGFTLVEVLVATVTIIFLAIALLSLQYILSQSRVLVWKNYLNVDQANNNLKTLVRELRTARAGDNGAYPLELASDQEIIFYSDIDFDGQSEKVRYTVAGSQLTKGVIEPEGYPVVYPPENETTKVLTDEIRNGGTPIFYYYNGDWPADVVNNPLEVPARLSDTKMMRFYLRLNTEENQPEKDYILESYVQIRMLKDNL